MRNFLILLCGSLLIACIFMYYHYECFDGPFNLGIGRGGQYGESIGMHPPRLSVMYNLTFGSYTGIFMFMPILLVGVYGIFVFFRKPEIKILPEMIFIALYILTTFIVISSYGDGDMGGTFGPRYLTSILPFLAIPIAFAFKKIKYKIVLWIAILSAFINWCGVQYGDADSVFTNIGLFLLRGLNSNLAEWTYMLANTYVRKFNVVTHFSPLVSLAALLGVLCLIWKNKKVHTKVRI